MLVIVHILGNRTKALKVIPPNPEPADHCTPMIAILLSMLKTPHVDFHAARLRDFHHFGDSDRRARPYRSMQASP
jgi:hypothetical protein